MNQTMRYCVYILLGPGEATIRRTEDLLQSLWSYAPPDQSVDCYLVTDNCTHLNELQPLLNPFSELLILPNPLSNKTDCTNDRVTAGVFTAIGAIAKSSVSYSFVLKLDDDALIINPFHARLQQLFEQDHHAGMAGTLDCFPDGSPRPGLKSWAPKVRMAVSPRSAFREFRRSLAGHRPDSLHLNGFRRALIAKKARSEGYRDGLHVQGGSYALSHECTKAIAKISRGPCLFHHTGLGEDTALSLTTMAAGYQLRNFNRPGETFGVWWRTPTLKPAELQDRGHAIVHSVKYDNAEEEQSVRDYYRRQRTASERPYSVA